MNGYALAADLLPEDYRRALPPACLEAEEIRLRVGRSPTLLRDGREQSFFERSCQEKDLLCVLERASGASLHAVSDALREGYLSCRGVRIGVCGTVLPSGSEGGFGSFSSLCLRIPRECRGIGRELLPAVRENAGGGTLIVSPPGGGKTTLLRELIRCLSNGGLRIGVVDERNELSASDGGRAGFDLGLRSDVLIGAGKAEGAMLLLRSMNPQLIAMDEITRAEDLEAVRRIAGCGVGILASAHGKSAEEMRRRPMYRDLLGSGVFSLALRIEGEGKDRRYCLTEITR